MMAGSILKIDDLVIGGLDQSGLQIVEIYARESGSFCVYRTEKRVCVQFADDKDESIRQRALIAPLGTLRSDVNGLINGWRQSERHRDQARARLYDRRCADGLICAFTGDAASAVYDLTAVRNELISTRTGVARYQYMGVALAIVVFAYFVLWLASFPAFTASCVTDAYIHIMLVSIAGGALGAFLSIAMALKDRTVLPNLQWISNTCDAILRMLIGIISSAVLICLLKGGFGFSITQAEAVAGKTSPEDWMKLFALGFLAGFFERLVPDLLDKAAANVRLIPLQDKPPVSAPAAMPATPKIVTAPTPAETGDCASDTPLTEAETTPDAALPVATGGTRP